MSNKNKKTVPVKFRVKHDSTYFDFMCRQNSAWKGMTTAQRKEWLRNN